MDPVKIKKILNKEKKVKINGIVFVIKRISLLDFYEDKVIPFGFNQTTTEKNIQERIKQSLSIDKLKAHYALVFKKAVIKPKITEEDSEDGVSIDELFKDWDLANNLYEAIFKLSFGKKKTLLQFLKKGFRR